jgi:multiphosphoryl transfer protein
VVNIIVVSHSAKLAESVCELAGQVAQGDVCLVAVGGIDDPRHPFGSDAAKVLEAIESAYTEEGVLIIADIGSSVMNVEMALELMPLEKRKNVRLCGAPMIEGAIVAAALVAAGASIDQVEREACNACNVKSSIAGKDLELAPSDDSREETLVVRNLMGLHARPAAQCVMAASRFNSVITMQNLTKKSAAANVRSINQIARLNLQQGHEVRLVAKGADSEEAIALLKSLFSSNFGELLDLQVNLDPVEKPVSSKKTITGIPVSPGVVICNAYLFNKRIPDVPEYPVDDVDVEWSRLQDALEQTKHKVHRLCHDVRHKLGAYDLAIFDVHLLCLRDPELIESSRKIIFEDKINAEAAWVKSIDRHLQMYSLIPDAYKQSCAADIVDVKTSVLQILTGENSSLLILDKPAILVADDLDPSDVLRLETKNVLGLCLAKGNNFSHAVILARSLGIPTVIDCGKKVLEMPSDALLAMDASLGQVWVNPSKKKLTEVTKLLKDWQSICHKREVFNSTFTAMADGSLMNVVANICNFSGAQKALEYGAGGVGLLRTEFLFLNYQNEPTEEEQFQGYCTIAKLMGEKPCVIRTLDIGGDKLMPCYEGHYSFMERRGIRFGLAFPQILKKQLRAILRAAVSGNVKILFPMVSSVGELRQAKSLLNEAKEELKSSGERFNEGIEVGVMVEVPSACVIADRLAKEVDFFSIGSNDLAQYLMAVDRTSTEFSTLGNPLQLAHLRTVRQVARAAHKAGIWVSVCGEMASNPMIAPLLLGLGIDEFSVDPIQVPCVKKVLSQITKKQSERWATAVLCMDSVESVENYLKKQYGKLVS